jgi:hypothetical protein
MLTNEYEKIKEIEAVFTKYPGLKYCYADFLGIDEADERIYWGWPEKLACFSKGWIASKQNLNREESEEDKWKNVFPAVGN